MTKTEMMIKDLENVDFVTREQAAELAKTAFKDYSKRSKAAKELDRSLWNMCLSGGCPNEVFNKSVALVQRYSGK
ncbi:MAG: hypothetical protein GY804_02690 [Alphaproteobacteria bacterium]|nr:hypothetical protein [Alphaproteobacteria bacterium]